MRSRTWAWITPGASLAAFALAGCGGGGGGGGGSSTPTPPAPPSSFALAQPTAEHGAVALSWSNIPSGTTGLVVQRSTAASGPFTTVPEETTTSGGQTSDVQLSASTTSYVDGTGQSQLPTSGSGYAQVYYRIEALTGSGNQYSTVQSVTPTGPAGGATISGGSFNMIPTADFESHPGHVVFTLTLGSAAVASDLTSVTIDGTSYPVTSSDVTVNGSVITFDTATQGITLPSGYSPISGGTDSPSEYTLSATYNGATLALTEYPPTGSVVGNQGGVSVNYVVNFNNS